MQIKKMWLPCGLVFLIFFSTAIIYEANAHSLFNSAESTIGDYRVQIATLPEIPSTGEKSQILLRITDRDLNEVDRFTSGIRIFFNDEEVDTIPPQAHDGSHWQTDYVFQRSGNHIFRVDLYDVTKDGGVITYTFNVSTQNPFGYIFIYSIAAGSIGFAAILGYIYLPKRLRFKTKS